VSLKNRIGAFFLLAGVLFLFIFAASAMAPAGTGAGPDVLTLAGGAALMFIGARWRMAKGGRPSAGPPAAAGGDLAGMPSPKKRGPLSALLKGPGPKGAGPKGGPPKAGGPPGGAKPGGGGGGKPGGQSRK
jgi:hypothetical protein